MSNINFCPMFKDLVRIATVAAIALGLLVFGVHPLVQYLTGCGT